LIKLKDILKEETLPKALYHSVSNERKRDFVLQNGIKGDDQGMVYLSEKPMTKPPYKYSFKVKVPDVNKLWNWEEIWGDGGIDKENDPNNPFYVYEGDIPKQNVTLI